MLLPMSSPRVLCIKNLIIVQETDSAQVLGSREHVLQCASMESVGDVARDVAHGRFAMKCGVNKCSLCTKLISLASVTWEVAKFLIFKAVFLCKVMFLEFTDTSDV